MERVDFSQKILKALGRALRDVGHAVIETTNPRNAQKLLAERSFDVLIVDNIMPQLSGLDLIREYVGSTPEHERSQILMMTAILNPVRLRLLRGKQKEEPLNLMLK